MIVSRPIFGGKENPRRTSRSRRPNTAVSTVMAMVEYPAAAARASMSRTSPRSRHTYTWNHRSPSDTARTSSMERVAIVFPNGTTERTRYDGGDRVVAATNRAGSVTAFTYDTLSRKLTETGPAAAARTAIPWAMILDRITFLPPPDCLQPRVVIGAGP